MTVRGGSQFRSMIHIKDVAFALYLMHKKIKKNIKNPIFHIGDEKNNFTVMYLAKIVSKLTKSKVKVSNKIDDQRSYRISCKKFNKCFKWKPKIKLENALIELIKYIKKNKSKKIFNNKNYFNIKFDYYKSYK